MENVNAELTGFIKVLVNNDSPGHDLKIQVLNLALAN